MDNLISVGIKIELKQTLNRNEAQNENARNYVSQVLDISDITFQAAMPIYGGHLVPLEVGTKYDVIFKTEKGLYKAVCEVIGRSKIEKIYLVELKPVSKLEKFQRREYFRFNTNIDASICLISENEMKNFIQLLTFPEDYKNKKKTAAIIDISGGGVKIVSNELYKKNDIVLIEFNMMVGSIFKNVNVLGRVIASTTSDNRLDLREHRIEYNKIPKEIRELIVKYIFDEQKKILQKERG